LTDTHPLVRWSFLAVAAATAVLVLALLLPNLAAAKQAGHPAHHHFDGGKGKVAGVMTRNLYLGADLGPAIAAKTPEQLVTANGVIFRQVLANDFPTRAEGLADEILRTKPDLVGLQEVALWNTNPISPAGTALTLDYLDLLLAELNQGKKGKGKPEYEVVIVQSEFGAEAPADVNGIPNDGPPLPTFGDDAEVIGKLTMRDVILAREGAGIRTWNEEGGNFDKNLELPIGGQVVEILRGWTATDAKVRGSHPFRFVNTHLEAFHPVVRKEQAEELVDADGPANSPLPVVLLGDLNSDDDTVVFPDTLAYDFLLGAGFVNRSTNDPLSCCLDSPLLGVKAAEEAGAGIGNFDHQVDHVLTRDPDRIGLKDSEVTGLQPVNGFWNSDHAGVFSSLVFK
jgi:Endonuclease/Exonuclease/phosphatase family